MTSIKYHRYLCENENGVRKMDYYLSDDGLTTTGYDVEFEDFKIKKIEDDFIIMKDGVWEDGKRRKTNHS